MSTAKMCLQRRPSPALQEQVHSQFSIDSNGATFMEISCGWSFGCDDCRQCDSIMTYVAVFLLTPASSKLPLSNTFWPFSIWLIPVANRNKSVNEMFITMGVS